LKDDPADRDQIEGINPNKSLNEDPILCPVTLPFSQKYHGYLLGSSLSCGELLRQWSPTLLMILALFAVLAAVVAISLGT
jgi:hypothetical protein